MPLIRRYYTKPDPRTGRRVRKPVKKWYLLYKKNGKWKREPAYSDKASSLQLLARRERECARESIGLIDQYTKAATIAIADHISHYAKNLVDRGNSHNHVTTTEYRVRWVCANGGIELIGDLTKARVESALARLTGESGLSASSRNHYLTAIKGFAKWLVDERRAEENYVGALRKKSVDGKRVKVRRPLTVEEFDKLLRAAAASKERIHNLTGADRVAVYLTAYATGYRRRELATLTPASFEFGKEPAVSIGTRASKRDRPERIPLNSSIAAYLKTYLTGRPTSQPLWRIANRNTAEMIQTDLSAARIKFQAGIETVDFHSLRQTFTTGLVRSGASPKVTQQLARHSDINLTMGVYAKLNSSEERAAVEALSTPSFLAQGLAQGRTPNGTLRRENGTLPDQKPPGDNPGKPAPNGRKAAAAKRKKPRI
jgi:site-specific recombinase XerD